MKKIRAKRTKKRKRHLSIQTTSSKMKLMRLMRLMRVMILILNKKNSNNNSKNIKGRKYFLKEYPCKIKQKILIYFISVPLLHSFFCFSFLWEYALIFADENNHPYLLWTNSRITSRTSQFKSPRYQIKLQGPSKLKPSISRHLNSWLSNKRTLKEIWKRKGWFDKFIYLN